MNVLLIGACGYLGPHVAKALAPQHRLRITDIRPPSADMKRDFADHEFSVVDVAASDHVAEAAKGMDAIVNLSVVRNHPVQAFRVNVVGCQNVMRAAAKHGIRRVINTGPHFTVAGPGYEGFDHGITPDIPPHSGTGLYALTKSLGQEICRAFSASHDVYVQDYLFYSLMESSELKPGRRGVPFVVTWSDAAQAVRLGVEIDLARLPSKCEVFFILGDCPQGKFLNEKAKRILGFAPRDDVSVLWRKG